MNTDPHQTSSATVETNLSEKVGAARPLLEIRDLRTYFMTRETTARAVDGVSFSIDPGKTLGIVGESGCGKSVTALSILRLVPDPPGKIVGGEIRFDGVDLLKLPEKEMRKIRGEKISMIFQEPMTSLNPVFTVGSQIAEVFRVHRNMSKREAFQESVRMLETVRMSEPARRAREYPHQMSGGMRQRVMIAMALACNPSLLIADEPTTALDVTVQAQILRLMKELQQEFGSAIMMITHDLGIIAEMADRVVVMYAGQIVEDAEVRQLFHNPLHPYTQGLMKSVPRLDQIRSRQKRLNPIPGNVPDPAHHPAGCRFHPRCQYVVDRNRVEMPELEIAEPGHEIRCFRWREIKDGSAEPHVAPVELHPEPA